MYYWHKRRDVKKMWKSFSILNDPNHESLSTNETTHNKSFQNNLHPSPSSPLKTLFNALQVNKSSSRPRRRRRRETLKEISLERRNASEGGREERRRRGGRWGKGEKSRTIQPIGLHNSVLLEMREVRVPWFPAHKEPRPTISLSLPAFSISKGEMP